MGYSLISWISGIALGIEGYRFGHRYGDQKMCDLRGMFQVTRTSDKLHVAILLLDSGFGEASVTAQGCFFNISQHGHYLNQHHHHHHHHQHHHHQQAHDALWISFLHTLHRSTYPNISTLFNVTISYILHDRPSCNYPGRPAHCDCSSVALWHQKTRKSCAQQEGSIINKV